MFLAVGVDPPIFQTAGVQQLVNEAIEAVEIVDHAAVEAFALLLAHLPSAERLQVELHRGDGRLELVGHTVDEVRLPAVEIDSFDREHEVDDRAGQQHADERRAERKQRVVDARYMVAPNAQQVDQHPADRQHDQDRDHHDRERDRQFQGAS